jgi:hypothetical protein
MSTLLVGARPILRTTGARLCADIDGCTLHAAVRCGADERQALEQLCGQITRPALASERALHRTRAGADTNAGNGERALCDGRERLGTRPLVHEHDAGHDAQQRQHQPQRQRLA